MNGQNRYKSYFARHFYAVLKLWVTDKCSLLPQARTTSDEPQGTMGRVQLSPSRLPLQAHFHRERDVWVRGSDECMCNIKSIEALRACTASLKIVEICSNFANKKCIFIEISNCFKFLKM